MFERFTKPARQVVTLADQEARLLRSGFIGTGHLLLGVLRESHGVGARVLVSNGADLEEARAATARLYGVGGTGLLADPGDLLRSIGIDLDEVMRRTEEAFGPAAVGRAVERTVRRTRRRRTAARRCTTGGALSFSPRAKRALELSLREALRLGHRHIGTEHVLLGILGDAESPPPRRPGRGSPADPGVAGLLLSTWDLTTAFLRTAVEQRIRQAG